MQAAEKKKKKKEREKKIKMELNRSPICRIEHRSLQSTVAQCLSLPLSSAEGKQRRVGTELIDNGARIQETGRLTLRSAYNLPSSM